MFPLQFLAPIIIAAVQFALPIVAAQAAIVRLGRGEFFRDRTEYKISWQVNAVNEFPAISQSVTMRLTGRSGIIEILDLSPKRQVSDTRVAFNPRYQFALNRGFAKSDWSGGDTAFPVEGFGAVGHTEIQNFFPNSLFKIKIAGDFYTLNELDYALTSPNYRSRFRGIGEGEFLLEGKYAAPDGEYIAEYEFAIRMPLDKDWAYIRSCKVINHYANPPDDEFIRRRETVHTVEESGGTFALRSRKTAIEYAKKFELIGIRDYRTQFEVTPIECDEDSPEFTLPHYGFPEPDLEIHLPVFPQPKSKSNFGWAWWLISIPIAFLGFFAVRRWRKLNAGSAERR